MFNCCLPLPLPSAWFSLCLFLLLPSTGITQTWSSFEPTPLTGAYVSLTWKHSNQQQIELWREARAIEAIPWRRLVVEHGLDLDQLSPHETVFSAELVSDLASPNRHFSRSTVNHHPGVGYTALVCVTKAYRPGEYPLLPALFFSASGAADTWRYLGQLRGEPAAAAAQDYIWSDGGAVFRLGDGRWRIYLNGYGRNLTAVESKTLAGEWYFLRNAEGSIRELAADLSGRNPRGDGYAFPSVVRRSDTEWHAWLSDRWPPESIWHLRSNDGLDWHLVGKQAEITTTDTRGKRFKNLRVSVTASGKLLGLLSVWDYLPSHPDREGWRLYRANWLDGA